MRQRAPLPVRFFAWLLAWLLARLGVGGENSQVYTKETVVVVKTSAAQGCPSIFSSFSSLRSRIFR